MRNVFNSVVGCNLAALRQAAGMSQTALAEAFTTREVPLTQQAIARLENGVRPLRAQEIAVAASILGVPVSALLATEPATTAVVHAVIQARVIHRRHLAATARLVEAQAEAQRASEEAEQFVAEKMAELAKATGQEEVLTEDLTAWLTLPR